MEKAHNCKSNHNERKSHPSRQTSSEKRSNNAKSITIIGNNCKSTKEKPDSSPGCENKTSPCHHHRKEDRTKLSDSQWTSVKDDTTDCLAHIKYDTSDCLVDTVMSFTFHEDEATVKCICEEDRSLNVVQSSKSKPCFSPHEESSDCDESSHCKDESPPLTEAQKIHLDCKNKQEALTSKWKKDIDEAQDFLDKYENDCLTIPPTRSQSVHDDTNSNCDVSKSKSKVAIKVSSSKGMKTVKSKSSHLINRGKVKESHSKSKVSNTQNKGDRYASCTSSEDDEEYSDGEISNFLDDMLESEGSAISQVKSICPKSLGEDLDDTEEDEDECACSDEDEEDYRSAREVLAPLRTKSALGKKDCSPQRPASGSADGSDTVKVTKSILSPKKLSVEASLQLSKKVTLTNINREDRPAMYGEEAKKRVLDLVSQSSEGKGADPAMKSSNNIKSSDPVSKGNNAKSSIASDKSHQARTMASGSGKLESAMTQHLAESRQGSPSSSKSDTLKNQDGTKSRPGSPSSSIGKSDSVKSQNVIEGLKSTSAKLRDDSTRSNVSKMVSNKSDLSPERSQRKENHPNSCSCSNKSPERRGLSRVPSCHCRNPGCTKRSKVRKHCSSLLEESLLPPSPNENLESTRIDKQESKCNDCSKQVKACISKNKEILYSISTIEQILCVLEDKVRSIENESKSEIIKESEHRNGCPSASGKSQDLSKMKSSKRVEKSDKKKEMKYGAYCNIYGRSESNVSKKTSKRYSVNKLRSKCCATEESLCNDIRSSNKDVKPESNKYPQKLILTISARFEDESGNSNAPSFHGTGTLDLVKEKCKGRSQSAKE